MKSVLVMFLGIVIGVAAWIPLETADRYSIPFGEAVLAIIGTLVGGIVFWSLS